MIFAKELSEALGMEVELVKPAADYDQFVQTALRGGERFDLIYLNTPLMDVLVAQKALIPLTDFIKASPILSDPSVIPTGEWKCSVTRMGPSTLYSINTKAVPCRLSGQIGWRSWAWTFPRL